MTDIAINSGNNQVLSVVKSNMYSCLLGMFGGALATIVLHFFFGHSEMKSLHFTAMFIGLMIIVVGFSLKKKGDILLPFGGSFFATGLVNIIAVLSDNPNLVTEVIKQDASQVNVYWLMLLAFSIIITTAFMLTVGFFKVIVKIASKFVKETTLVNYVETWTSILSKIILSIFLFAVFMNMMSYFMVFNMTFQ